jgi:hypothetical protein
MALVRKAANGIRNTTFLKSLRANKINEHRNDTTMCPAGQKF